MEPAGPTATRVALLALLTLLPLSTAAPTADQQLRPFLLEDFVDAKFTARTFSGTWVADNLLRFYNSTTREVSLYDVATSSNNRTLVPSDVLKRYKDSSIDSYSKDGKLVAISFESEKIYRHSTKSRFVIYNTDDGNTYPVGEEDHKLRTLVWAGDRSIVWVRDNDVYYRKDALSAGPDIAITSDGREGIVFNGIPDWVYEEEVLASGSALWPSPDGSKLAFASFDDTRVNHTFYFEYGFKNNSIPQYPQVIDITYPKAGTPNPDVVLRVVDLNDVAATNKVTLVTVPPPLKVSTEPILYGCFWTSSRLLASWTNRAQNINVISSCDMQGKCHEALSQQEEAGWVDPPALKMHSTGRRAAAILPKDDRPHLAVVTFTEADDGAPATVTYLTSGNVTVLNILGWDEDRGHLYFVQTQPEDPAKRHVYRVAVPGEDSNHVAPLPPACLTCDIRTPEENLCSYAGAALSKGFTYAIVGCLGPDPAFYSLYRLQEMPIGLERKWDENLEVRALLATRLRPEIVDDWLPVADGRFRARVRLLVPPGADRSGSTKYPLLVFVYAGPDSNQVTTAFSVQFGDYLSSSRKIVYALIDGRGSGRNGRTLMHAVYRHLGTAEIQDQISVAAQLKKKYPFVDPDRTAIWGWSYGGFATAHAMAQDTQQVFCCGVSVAPVTSFIYYDTIYTERYMGLPKDDNEAGYNGTDVSRNVANFRHKKYLLIHGNADDNVHYQQSMQLTRALEEADILFQQQSYPDEAHALAGVKRHVYHTMDDFWTRAFKLPKPEWSNRARG